MNDSSHPSTLQQRTVSYTIPESARRNTAARIPAIPELQCVRHYTRLSQQNFSIDTHTYPLGSCTMKYNPKVAHVLASLPGYNQIHPYTNPEDIQGPLQCLHELQQMLTDVTGMSEIALSTMAGAQGEFAGVAMIKAYHEANKDFARNEILVPDAAHGTNPASAVQCGYAVREIPTTKEGDIDLAILKTMVGPNTAGIMLTNPSTLGVFERKITQVADIIHQAGGLLYYDGANLNAIMGHFRPGDMGFDVMHLNLHKTFATPHGGGGPGSGPVLANDTLKAFLPTPIIAHNATGYYWADHTERPLSIGRCSTFMGNTGVLLRAYAYIKLLGKTGIKRASQIATLNANYLMHHLEQMGYTLAFPTRRASHEFIITLKPELENHGVTALDVAKRLLDYGIHAPTIYFPLLVAECLLIEPTETESKQELDNFLNVMQSILKEIQQSPDIVTNAPHNLSIGRVNELRAAREPDLADYRCLNQHQKPITTSSR